MKINVHELLAHELKRKKVGGIWISGVCDPYQPLEKKNMITRRRLALPIEKGWPFTVQTRSSLVLRDIETLKRANNAEVGFTMTTADERIRRIFEPGAPPSRKRIEALAKLNSEGIKTFAMVAPILPGAEELVNALKGNVEYVILDRLNYHYADWAYKRYGMQWAMEYSFFSQKGEGLKMAFEREGIPCQMVL